MLSDITASPITSITVDPTVPSTTEAGPMVELGQLAPITSPIKRVGNLLRAFAVAPVWPLGVFVEAQALLELAIRTPLQNQDFLWRGRREGDLYEPDPFAAETPFQRDVWPF
jgi:hypothetical protein